MAVPPNYSMSQLMLCPHCGAEIPAKNIKPRRAARCPNCKATINLMLSFTDNPAPTYPKQMERPLPGGLTVEEIALNETDEKLVITWPWRRFGSLLWLVGVFVCAGGMALGGRQLWGQGALYSLVAGFLLLGAVIGVYVTLATLVNKATIIVTPAALTIRHGPLPLPPWKTFQVDTPHIKQLYVDEKINAGQGSVAYHYQLYVLTDAGKSINLFPDLKFTEWDKILYLEQEIERYLNLPDEALLGEPVSVSLNPVKKEVHAAWLKLAERHQLDFIRRSPLKGSYLSGLYRGRCYVELDTVSTRRSDEDQIRTRLLCTLAGHDTTNRTEDADITLSQIAHILARPGPFPGLKGSYHLDTDQQRITYEQAGVEGDEVYLQFLLDTFSDLLAAYPQIIALGGEAVLALESILQDEIHPYAAVVPQLLSEIAETTRLRWADRLPRLRCSRCLGRCVDFSVALSPLKSLTYYGCQSCAQSQQFFEFEGQVVAVLDSAMASPQVEQAAVLRVNWLARRTLFSFDSVEIIRATDEEVERFAVQVGNDTDPARQPRYRGMRCLVSTDCTLTENTLRILRRTFGQVYRP